MEQFSGLTDVASILSLHAKARPSSPAIEDEDRVWTYAELHASATELRTQLEALGVASGDRVAIVGENSARFVAAFFGVLQTGAAAVNVSARLASPEVKRVIEHASCKVAVFVTTGSKSADEHATALQVQRRIQGSFGSWPILASSQTTDTSDQAGIATIVYTSGTTGRPKGAMLTHANLLFVARTIGKLRQYTCTDKTYCVLPLNHVGGLAAILLTSLYAGACVVLHPRFAPAEMAKKIAQGLTAIPGVPSLFAKFLQWASETGYQLPEGHCLRVISSSAGFLDSEAKHRLELYFGVPCINSYALTETCGVACQTEYIPHTLGSSVGSAVPGVSLRLVPEAAPDTPDAQGEGEIQLKGANIFRGYFADNASTAETFTADGWLRTGDIGTLDASGQLTVRSRKKDVVKRSGFNVYPADIEVLLNGLEGVGLSAVVGHRHADDEQITAFVQLSAKLSVEPPTSSTIQAWLHEQLAAYKLPNRVIVLDELPLLANGKVDKLTLKHRCESNQFQTSHTELQ